MKKSSEENEQIEKRKGHESGPTEDVMIKVSLQRDDKKM